jgi:hypothetical protein
VTCEEDKVIAMIHPLRLLINLLWSSSPRLGQMISRVLLKFLDPNIATTDLN